MLCLITCLVDSAHAIGSMIHCIKDTEGYVLRSLESVKVCRELGLNAISVAVLTGFSHLQWDRSLSKSSVL